MNKLQRYAAFFMLLASTVLAGCATPQPPVPMDQTFWSNQQDRIGIAISEIPKASVQMIGQQGLLDVAVNKSMASSLTTKVESWDPSTLRDLQSKVANHLQAQGYSVTLLDEPFDATKFKAVTDKKLGYTEVDLSPLRERQLDKLVLLLVGVNGTSRSYYGMIPTSDPVAQLSLTTTIVDLHDNRLLYFQPSALTRAAQGEWDEAPDFPNLTNAYYQVLDEASQTVLLPFDKQQISSK